jgi:hypothetical protein
MHGDFGENERKRVQTGLLADFQAFGRQRRACAKPEKYVEIVATRFLNENSGKTTFGVAFERSPLFF